ncbi:hypothetical protein MesoLj131a_57360 [Mesorhizobium sp. 131-2-1]|nr:hypothetical protein MesoLj131a_57360 [Mesorhizobium sp. 131-2-1]
MGHSLYDPTASDRRAWNAGKKVGTKRPLKPRLDDFRPPCPCCGGPMIVIEVFEHCRQSRGPPGARTTNRETAP